MMPGGSVRNGHSTFRRARFSQGLLANRIQCSWPDLVESWYWSCPYFTGEGEGRSVSIAAPSHVLASSHSLFLNRARSDKAI
jgi:hypothetical protein